MAFKDGRPASVDTMIWPGADGVGFLRRSLVLMLRCFNALAHQRTEKGQRSTSVDSVPYQTSQCICGMKGGRGNQGLRYSAIVFRDAVAKFLRRPVFNVWREKIADCARRLIAKLRRSQQLSLINKTPI
jgi:hypothetical protein